MYLIIVDREKVDTRSITIAECRQGPKQTYFTECGDAGGRALLFWRDSDRSRGKIVMIAGLSRLINSLSLSLFPSYHISFLPPSLSSLFLSPSLLILLSLALSLYFFRFLSLLPLIRTI